MKNFIRNLFDPCPINGHKWKHFRIVKVSLFDDQTGGPASSSIETVERKCTVCGKMAEPVVTVTGSYSHEPVVCKHDWDILPDDINPSCTRCGEIRALQA